MTSPASSEAVAAWLCCLRAEVRARAERAAS